MVAGRGRASALPLVRTDVYYFLLLRLPTLGDNNAGSASFFSSLPSGVPLQRRRSGLRRPRSAVGRAQRRRPCAPASVRSGGARVQRPRSGLSAVLRASAACPRFTNLHFLRESLAWRIDTCAVTYSTTRAHRKRAWQCKACVRDATRAAGAHQTHRCDVLWDEARLQAHGAPAREGCRPDSGPLPPGAPPGALAPGIPSGAPPGAPALGALPGAPAPDGATEGLESRGRTRRS
jgi:hypothetical protein